MDSCSKFFEVHFWLCAFFRLTGRFCKNRPNMSTFLTRSKTLKISFYKSTRVFAFAFMLSCSKSSRALVLLTFQGISVRNVENLFAFNYTWMTDCYSLKTLLRLIIDLKSSLSIFIMILRLNVISHTWELTYTLSLGRRLYNDACDAHHL